MRKTALINSCYVCAAGAFGAFFRWLQNQSCFDTETGLLNPSALNYIVPLSILAAAVLFYFLVGKLKKQSFELPKDIFEVFNGTSILYPLAYMVIALLTLVGSIVTLVNCAGEQYAPVYRLIAGLAAITAVTFPVICSSRRRRYAPGIIGVFMCVPVAMFAAMLLLCYELNSSNPVIGSFWIEIITCCLCMLAFLFNAGFAFDKPEPHKSMFLTMFAAFMCFTTLADSRYIGLQIIYLGSAGMLVTELWMIISNMREPAKAESAPEGKTEDSPEDKVEDESDAEKVQVIEPGNPEDKPEPTIQAPERKPKKPVDIDAVLDDCKKYIE